MGHSVQFKPSILDGSPTAPLFAIISASTVFLGRRPPFSTAGLRHRLPHGQASLLRPHTCRPSSSTATPFSTAPSRGSATYHRQSRGAETCCPLEDPILAVPNISLHLSPQQTTVILSGVNFSTAFVPLRFRLLSGAFSGCQSPPPARAAFPYTSDFKRRVPASYQTDGRGRRLGDAFAGNLGKKLKKKEYVWLQV
ncbi:uncharacterized protein LOC132168018 [Corylus avellana]|uniref:uncharacterized protein LOC132168018 n=1 Tax=Corylus avellana TaxID=13451 RepID=UPI00286AC57D|nr:uncharacterized protein LOC132168018 [Corylus avellana]